MSEKYGLSFISDADLFKHVKETVQKYRFGINLKEFNKNLIDPIKLTFDSKVYGKTIEEIIEIESIRQINKLNTSCIGYFHQNIFKYFRGDWQVLKHGYDVIHESRKIYAEMENKHNTMNSSSARKTYIKMQSKILKNDGATCYLVEIMAKKSHDSNWETSLDGEQISNRNIRRISIDKFYEIVTGNSLAFKELCEVLPEVIDHVILDGKNGG